MDFIAIDFETATSDRSSACAIGMTEVENGKIIGTHYTMIKPPGNLYLPINIEIHGITPEMTEDYETFRELWSWIKSVIDGKILVAHNASFDKSVLNKCVERFFLSEPSVRGFVCSCNLARKVVPWLENHKLPTVAKHFGIKLEHHDAASDSEVCARITLEMLTKSGLSLEYYLDTSKTVSKPNKCLSCPQNRSQIKYRIEDVKEGTRFNNGVFVFTGCSSPIGGLRDCEVVVKKIGAAYSSSTTKKTTHVVTGLCSYESRNYRRAIELKEKGLPITIWTMPEFLEKIEDVEYQYVLPQEYFQHPPKSEKTPRKKQQNLVAVIRDIVTKAGTPMSYGDIRAELDQSGAYEFKQGVEGWRRTKQIMSAVRNHIEYYGERAVLQKTSDSKVTVIHASKVESVR